MYVEAYHYTNMQNTIQRALSKNQWTVETIDGMQLTRSPLLKSEPGLTHAFTTRHGGECPSPYDNFNLGRSVGDDTVKAFALKNRQRLLKALELNHDILQVPGQVHSGNVVKVHHGATKQDLSGVDGLATTDKHLPVLLHFADCVPVLVYERDRELLAIVHAGWRGTAQSIAGRAVEVLESLGGNPAHMVAAVGPAIGPCCYPTGQDVVYSLLATLKANDKGETEQLKQAFIHDNNRPDLKAINAMQLLQRGVATVDVTSYCTSCLPEMFYSHRQSGGITGRQGAIGCLV